MTSMMFSGDYSDAVEDYQLIQSDSAVLIDSIRPISLCMYVELASDQVLMLCYVVLVLLMLVDDLSAWIVVFAREHQIRAQSLLD
jgi:hypothetical protein